MCMHEDISFYLFIFFVCGKYLLSIPHIVPVNTTVLFASISPILLALL